MTEQLNNKCDTVSTTKQRTSIENDKEAVTYLEKKMMKVIRTFVHKPAPKMLRDLQKKAIKALTLKNDMMFFELVSQVD